MQVNAGPLAYANAFLDPTLAPMYSDDMVEKLKAIFKYALLFIFFFHFHVTMIFVNFSYRFYIKDRNM